MSRLRALVLAFLINGCGTWSAGNATMETAYAVSMSVDWGQTAGIARDCSEINPVMGRCGDRVPVWMYFPLAMLAHIGIASALRGEYRTAFQGTTLGIELATIFWNSHL